MRLLILTQAVDRNDPILGFFHRWLEEFSRHFDALTVICLFEGEHSLPENVKVLSLGKDKGASRLGYVRSFYRHAWSERENYDSVFVHMNQEYVLLGGLMWKILGKRVTLWRNHPHGDLLTRIAVAFSDKVMCVSDKSYTARFRKTELMPAGIDTDMFSAREGAARRSRSVLYAGRVSIVKHPDLLVAALERLWMEGEEFHASFVGDPSKGSEEYYKSVRNASSVLEDAGAVSFFEGVKHGSMPELFSSHEIFVNLTDSGSFDKTVIEAMACGAIPLVSNRSFESALPPERRDMLMFEEGSAESLAERLRALLRLPDAEKAAIRTELRRLAVEKHSLTALARKLIPIFN